VTQERLDFAPAPVSPISLPTTPSLARLPAAPPSRLDRLRSRRRTWGAIRGLREVLLIAVVYSFYDVTRFLVEGDHDAAFHHGRALLNFEERLSIAPEHALNKLFTAHIALGLPADYIYATLHYIVTPAVLIWLWRRYPTSYSPARTVLIATTVIGLVGFSLLPVAPPRLLGGFQDTMAHFSHWGWWSNAGSAPRGLGADTNQFAAMPSLHVGWALWCGWQMVKHGQHRITRWLGIAYPIVLSVVVMATANHYLLDVVAGLAVVGAGAGLAHLITVASQRLRPQHIPGAIEAATPSPPSATS
jgi:hypothetical protein